MPEPIDIKEFARRVELVCDFLLNKIREERSVDGSSGLDGSGDLRVIQDLKEDAANIHMGDADVFTNKLSGLSDYMKGASVP